MKETKEDDKPFANDKTEKDKSELQREIQLAHRKVRTGVGSGNTKHSPIPNGTTQGRNLHDEDHPATGYQTVSSGTTLQMAALILIPQSRHSPFVRPAASATAAQTMRS